MANVSKLLYSSRGEESFLIEIDPGAAAEALLLEAKRKVRECLRDEFAHSSREQFGVVITPRFFTQGSHAYKTLNDPAWTPPQQMDLDDGCYLPMSFVQGALPSKAAALFFAFVDAALKKLAEKEGWTFKEKDTCARLIISRDAHIDVPLYAIPDVEWQKLEKAAVARANLRVEGRVADDRPDRWDAIPSDCVLLAHRIEDWKVSDPRKIRAWFLAAVELYGERLRRISRYMKAWRDYRRPELDGVSSILLMVCAWQAFEEMRRPFVPERDDEALLRVFDILPTYLAGRVENPTDKSEDINRLTAEARKTAIREAKSFRDQLRDTINVCCDPEAAVEQMMGLLGDRIPDRPDLVDVALAAKAAVLSQPKKQVAAPEVGRSKSG